MRIFLKTFAWFCIATTPFQVLLIFWASWIVATTDFGILSLSAIRFFDNYLTIFLPFIDWLYSWLWNAYLDFVLNLPLLIIQTIKAVLSTWLGFWILKKIE